MNTTATEIPSPAAMPRVCMRPSLPRRSDADTVRVTLTVESAPDTAFSEQPTCVACAAVDGDSSGVLTGPHGAVLDSLIRWLRTTPPFQTAHCSPALYVHRASGTETAEGEADAVFDALFRARMLPRSVEFPACPDPATLSVRPVVRGAPQSGCRGVTGLELSTGEQADSPPRPVRLAGVGHRLRTHNRQSVHHEIHPLDVPGPS